MFIARTSLASLAALTLCACGQTGAAPTEAVDAPDANAEPESVALTPQMLVGRWGDNGDCTKDITFSADGGFRSFTGGEGTWTLDGDVMSMTGASGTFQVRVALIDGDTLMIGNPDGSYGLSQRCP